MSNTKFQEWEPVLVRDHDHASWILGAYFGETLIYGSSINWNQMIPYAGNESLLGTSNPGPPQVGEVWEVLSGVGMISWAILGEDGNWSLYRDGSGMLRYARPLYKMVKA